MNTLQLHAFDTAQPHPAFVKLHQRICLGLMRLSRQRQVSFRADQIRPSPNNREPGSNVVAELGYQHDFQGIHCK